MTAAYKTQSFERYTGTRFAIRADTPSLKCRRLRLAPGRGSRRSIDSVDIRSFGHRLSRVQDCMIPKAEVQTLNKYTPRGYREPTRILYDPTAASSRWGCGSTRRAKGD